MTIPIKENNIQKEENIIIKEQYFDEIRIMCRYCGNRHAKRYHDIRKIREAGYMCTNCGKRIK